MPTSARVSEAHFNAFNKWWSNRSTWTGLMTIFKDCQLVSAEPGRNKFEVSVHESFTNTMGSMHGGCAFTFLDVCVSSAAFDPLKHVEKQTGVTTGMNISYLIPAQVGETLIIDCKLISKNEYLACCEGQMYRKSDGKVVATALQTLALLSDSK